MKILKLVVGILSMVLAVFIIFQSCAAGFGNALAENGESGGSAGLFLAFLLLISGIVDVITRNSQAKGGDIAAGILCLIGAGIGFLGAGSYSDLKIWAVLCVVFAIVYFVDLLNNKKNNK